MSTATLSETPEPIAKRSDERKIARNRALLLLGHEGVMLDKIQQQSAHLMKLAKGQVGESATEEPSEAPEEDDVGVNIGNETHYHLEMKEQPAVATPAPVVADKPALPAPVAAIPAAVAPLNPLLAAALGGGLVLAGGLLSSWWNGPTETPAESPPVVEVVDPNWGLGVEVRPHKE